MLSSTIFHMYVMHKVKVGNIYECMKSMRLLKRVVFSSMKEYPSGDMKMFALDKRDFCTLLHDSTILCIVTFLEYELDQFSK